MNILVDGRPFVKSSAGISTVLRCVLVSWADLKPDDRLYVVMPKPLHDSIRGYKFSANIIFCEAKMNVFKYFPNLIYLIIMVPYLIKKYHVDVYYSPVPNLPFFIPRRVKTIVEVNDVVNIEFKETMALKNKIANYLFFNRSIKKADLIWSISEYTKGRIEHYFPKRRCKNIFVGCSVDRMLFRQVELSQNEREIIREKYGIKDRFILFVGSIEPRKNLTFLLEIIPEIFERSSIQFVVVGAKGWKTSSIKDVIEKNTFPKESTIFCGYVSNEDLVKLYNMADCFLSTSLNEGFGLPQLEAFMCGCPVITAENSAMIEVAKDKSGGLLISGFNHKEWIEKTVSFLDKHKKVRPDEFQEYDWNTIISRLLNTIEDI